MNEALHWHAYAHTGPIGGPSPGTSAKGEHGDYWLRRPASDIVATFTRPEDAEAWMRAQAEHHPALLPADAESSLLYLRQILHDKPHKTPSLYYADRHERMVERYLVPCPRPSWEHNPTHRPPPCPLGRRRP